MDTLRVTMVQITEILIWKIGTGIRIIHKVYITTQDRVQDRTAWHIPLIDTHRIRITGTGTNLGHTRDPVMNSGDMEEGTGMNLGTIMTRMVSFGAALAEINLDDTFQAKLINVKKAKRFQAHQIRLKPTDLVMVRIRAVNHVG
eukprot:396621_1